MPRKLNTEKDSKRNKKSLPQTPTRSSERIKKLQLKAARNARVLEIIEKKEEAKKYSPKRTTKDKDSKKSHPTYESMIKRCLKTLTDDDRDVISYNAICKYIEDKFPVYGGFKRFVKMALKKGVEEGTFIQTRASFRLSAKSRKRRSSSRSQSPSRKTRSQSPSSKRSSSSKKRAASESPKVKSKKSSTRKSRTSTKESAVSDSDSSTSTPTKKKVARRLDLSAPVESSNAYVPTSKYSHIWQYQDNGWKNYDPEASDVVEEVYQGYLGNRGDTDVRAVKSGKWEYMVDFAAMKQTNIQHGDHKIREVRRVPNTAHKNSKV